jgi:flagellar hook assembly protein FlgD
MLSKHEKSVQWNWKIQTVKLKTPVGKIYKSANLKNQLGNTEKFAQYKWKIPLTKADKTAR